MNPLRPNTNAKEGNDEFLQLLRNRNCNSNDKPVFRRLLGYLNTESSNDQNDLCLRIETTIRNNKQTNKNNEAKQVKPRPAILTSNNQKEEYTKEQSKHNTPEIDVVKNDSLKMEDLFVVSELQTTSASIEDKQIVNANPFEMSKMEKEDKSLTITEDESVAEDNQDMLSCTSDPENSNTNTTDCSEIGSASIDIPRLEIETIGENILNKPENDTDVKNSLRDKIKERRLRNRTICDFADLRLITDSHDEIATPQSSIEKTNASMNEPKNHEHEENEKLANKIRNKRHRNRTICNEAFVNVSLQEQPDSNSAETNNPLLDIKLINISIEEETKNREEEIASSRLDSVTSMAKSYENAICKNNKATISSKSMHTESKKVNETMVAEPAKTKHKTHSSDLSIASTNNQMISFNYTEKNKIDSYEMNVENQNVNAQVKTHILKESDNYIFGDEDEKVKQPKNKNEKAEITIHKSMSGIIESTAIVKPLECPINQMMRNSRSKHNDPTRFNRNIPFNTLNEKTSDLLTKYTRHQLEKEIRDKGVFATIKRFFSKFFAKKWHEKNLVKMKKPDAFFNKLHKYILANYTKTPTMFRLTAERIYYTTYPEKAAKNEHIDFDALTPHQISALYKGYIRNIMKGFIPSKIAKNLVDYLKLDNISDEDKKKYLQTILPHLISDVERTHLKDIFQLWDMIADNFESTKMDIVSLCVVFGPSIINDDFIKDIRDSKYLATILECLYMSDLNRIDYDFYHKFTKKSKNLIK